MFTLSSKTQDHSSSTHDRFRALFKGCNRALWVIAGLTLFANTSADAHEAYLAPVISTPQCEINHPNLNLVAPSSEHLASDTQKDPVTPELTIEEESYADGLSAVIAASNYFNPISIQEDREYIGAILRHKRQGHFIYTVSSGESGEDTVSARIRIPSDYEITAFWHTHGNHHWTRKYFSDIDTQLANEWQLPFYMAEASGTLRVYRPNGPTLSSMRSYKMGLGRQSGYAKGKVVRHNQQRIRLATNMTQWIALHRAPAAELEDDRTASIAPASINSACDNLAKVIKSERLPGQS